MESVGKFEFSRKDLIGHGAFAVVFKGRHKEKHNWDVAVKCINRKNLAKSQSLLGKEIKILKELKHENIVRLLDYQEIGGCIYLVMEYCNGGDLAEYLHSKGTLSEDTIRVFLQQIAQAMKVLQSKGILHRDLKPQNILLCHPEGRKSSSISASIKIADFGFARHLQTNMMAATLCGSPMYMAPEVIMSQNYDAKADLWSIGTIVYQCLTGKAPFRASSPQELRLFYESNTTLLPSIPKETSPNLKHLLLGLLQRNHKNRITFDEFFHHPFLETSTSTKKCLLVAPIPYPTSGSGSSSSSSSTSQLASPQCSDGETHQPKEMSPAQDTRGFLQKEKANPDINNTPSYAEDYVMVPAQFPSEYTCDMESSNESCLICSGDSRPIVRVTGTTRMASNSSLLHSPPKFCSNPVQFDGPARSKSVPIPVPTQIQNYQRMKQNLQPAGVHGSTRAMPCCTLGSRGSRVNCGMRRASAPAIASFSTANFSNVFPGGQPQQFSPQVGQIPKTSEQNFPLSSRTERLSVFPNAQVTINPKHLGQPKKPDRTKTVPDLQCLYTFPDFQTNINHKAMHKKGAFKRSLSTGRLSDMLLKAAFGANLFEEESDESFGIDKSMDTTAPPAGSSKCFQFTESPPPVVFAMGSPSQGTTAPDAKVSRMFSGSRSHVNSAWLLSHTPPRGTRRNSETDVMDVILHRNRFFHLPGLPEDTLMEDSHVDALSDLRFTWAFVHCIMELASSKDAELEACSPDISFLQKSLVTDQISLLSREWSFAEQLVLYMKAEEFLSSALRTAKENFKQGQLQPSSIVKQVIRKLNDMYKSCVSFCRSLNDRLQTFLLDKQKLMDRFSGLTAEKLIYSHTVHMVQSAALDEMFHYGTSSVQRYNKALLLMEGLSRILTEQEDIESIDKCKECIEKRLSALQT